MYVVAGFWYVNYPLTVFPWCLSCLPHALDHGKHDDEEFMREQHQEHNCAHIFAANISYT